MIAAEALLRSLELSTYFVVPGRFSIPLNISLKRIGAQTIMIPDERCAGHAADGYARASGKPAGLIVSAGPGALNAALPIATAFRDYIPMIAIVGDVPTYSKGSLAVEEIDIKGVFKSICKDVVEIRSLRDLALVKKARDEALKPPKKPILIDYPLDVQESRAEIIEERIEEEVLSEEIEGVVQEIADMLKASKRPLILVGNGCLDAHNLVAEFSLRYEIPISYTLMAWCRVEEKPRTSLGFCGIRGFKCANEALRESDFILALGARLSETTIAYGLSENATVIQVLIEDNFHPNAHVKVKASCEVFIKKLIESYRGEKKGFWAKVYGEPTYESKAFSYMKRILDLSQGAILCLDMGDSSMWALEAMKHGWKGLTLYPGGLATMGFSISASIGAKIASPDRNVVAISGDGGAIMNLPALHAMSRLNLPIAIFIFNNKAYGMVRGKQLRDYGVTSDVDVNFEDFKDLASSAKIDYIKVVDWQDIEAALKASRHEPVIAEIDVDVDDRPPIPKKLFPSS